MSKLKMLAIGLILLLVVVSYVIPYILVVLIGIIVITSWVKGRKTSYMAYNKYQEYL